MVPCDAAVWWQPADHDTVSIMSIGPTALRFIHWIALGLAVYAFAAYALVPDVWRIVQRLTSARTPDMVTVTPSGIPGDPLNVGMVGDTSQVLRAMAKAGWDTADAITLKSAVEIGVSVLFDRPYPDAPISTLLFQGRPQNLAFEKPIGSSAAERHHARFWMTGLTVGGRPLWLGTASRDVSVGLNAYTGQFTHHIDADIDAQRDGLVADLSAANQLLATPMTKGIGLTLFGRNGEGDWYYTDGNLHLGVIKSQ
jgi:hypothetical protein